MAVRNISVQISANVRKYTDGLRTAEAATRKFQSAVQTSGQTSRGAARLHTQNERALLGVARGAGNAMTREQNYSAALRRTNRAMRDAQQATNGYGKALAFVKSAGTQAIGALAGFTLINGIINGARKAVTFLTESVMSFDSAMTRSLAIANNTTAAMRKAMEERARVESTLSIFSPAEIAEGYYYLVAAGLDVAQSMEAVGTAAAFAQAGVLDFEKGSEMLVQTQSALGLRSKDATENMQNMARVSDVLVQAANKSTSTVELMAEAFQNKFGTAVALANREVEEGAAILMAYAKVGIQGRLAGTQASMWLRDVQKAAINNAEAFREMDISVYDSNNNLNNLVDIAKDMREAFHGMSDKGLRMTLKDLGFADRAVHAILPLINTTKEEFDEFYEQSLASTGTTARVAAKQLKSLENQLKLLKQALQTAAERGGRAALNALYQAWDRLRKPVNALADNLKDFASSAIWPTLQNAATMIGGTLVAALEGAAYAGQAATAILSNLGKPLGFILSAVTSIFLVWKTWGMLVSVWNGIAGGVNLLTAAVARYAAAEGVASAAVANTTRAKLTGTAASIAAQQAATSAVVGGAFAETAAVNGATAATGRKIAALNLSALSWNGIAAAAARAGKAMLAAMMSPLGALAAVAAGLALIYVNAKKAEQSGASTMRSFIDAAESKRNMGDPDEVWDQINRQIEARDVLMEELEKLESRGPLGNLWTHKQRRELKGGIDELNESIETHLGELEGYYAALRGISEETGLDSEIIANQIQSMGLGTDLMQAVPGSEEYKKIIDDVTRSLEGGGRAAAITGQDLALLAQQEGEVAAETERLDEIVKEFGKTMAAGVDPSAIMSDLQEVADAINNAFSVSPSDVFQELTQEAEEAAREASEAAYESYSKGIDSQIKALRDARDALDKPKLGRGKKSDSQYAAHDAEVERIERQKKAYDDQIEAIEEAKKAREDFERTPGAIGMDAFVTRLTQTAQEAEKFRSNLDLLKARLMNMGISQSVVGQITGELAAMGPEAAPIIDQFVSDTTGKFEGWATSIVKAFETVNEGSRIGFEEFKRLQQEKWDEMFASNLAMIALSTHLADQGITGDQLMAFRAMGPEFAGMMSEMLKEVEARGEAGAKDVALTIKRTLGVVDLEEGAYGDAMAEAMTYMQATAGAKAAEIPRIINELVRKGLAKPDELAAIFRNAGDTAMAAFFEGMGNAAAGGNPRNDGFRRYVPMAERVRNDPLVGRFREKTSADGNILEEHEAKIYSGKDGIRVFNEPETGGEAYIPMGQSKRGRALPILSEVARRFGYQLNQYANGGFHGVSGSNMVGGGAYGTPAGREVLVVPVPVQSKQVTNFNGDIQGVKLEDAERYAARKRRQQRLTRS